jgi:hypothetical protein
MVVFLFSVLGAAVFAEPTVTEIEEMIGLIHKVRSYAAAQCREIFHPTRAARVGASCCARGNPTPNT